MLHKPERIKLFTSKIVILILVDEGRPHSDQLCFVGIKPFTVVLPKLFTLYSRIRHSTEGEGARRVMCQTALHVTI